MDIWLLLCMLFVALTILEYAVMLAIRFGKQKRDARENQEDKCNYIDRLALWIVMGIYILTVGAYFIALATHS